MSDHSIRIGDRIADRYRIDASLGTGGMGAVFEATDLRLRRKVAIKVIHGAAASRPETRMRFIREARVTASFTHPNVVEIYDFGETGHSPFLVMERLTGISLRDLLEDDQPRLPLQRAIVIASQVAQALEAAHASGLVHRDIKPDNIMLTEPDDPQGRVVLLDFGLAFIVGDSASTGRLTREGIICGTPLYLSPEQAQGQRTQGSASDVYSLGCVLFEMLTRTTPFTGSDTELLVQHMFKRPPSLSEVSGEALPNRVQVLVSEMLAKDPSERPTATQVFERLLRIDPAAAERLGRGRQGADMMGRQARMVSLPPISSDAVTVPQQASPHISLSRPDLLDLAVVGTAEPDFAVALAANGYRVVQDPPPQACAQMACVLLLGQPADAVDRYLASGRPVLADADASNFERVTAMLAQGVHEVVTLPIRPDRVAAQIDRLVRAHPAHGDDSEDT